MGVGEKVGEADRDGGRAKGGVVPASSPPPSSSPIKALKAPPIIWGIGRGATGDQRGKEESLCKGIARGEGK
jgi:hypothetical protein